LLRYDERYPYELFKRMAEWKETGLLRGKSQKLLLEGIGVRALQITL